jgi:hypothetical protein
MSNRAVIEPTFFQDQDQDFNSNGRSYYGFRIFDDFGMTYSTIAETRDGMMSILDEHEGERHIQWVKLVMQYNNEISEAILDHLEEHKKGIRIADVWYDWDEIKEAFED